MCMYGDASEVGQKTINPSLQAKQFLVICCVANSVNVMSIGNVYICAQSTKNTLRKK